MGAAAVIYILKTSENHKCFIKVGYSKRDVYDRIRAIRTGNHSPLDVLGIYEGDRQTERAIHSALSNFWMRGEWFEYNKKSMSILDGLGLVPATVKHKRPLSSLKKCINDSFRYRGPSYPSPVTLAIFCSAWNVDDGEVEAISMEPSSTFTIIETDAAAIMAVVGHVKCQNEQWDTMQKYIIPKECFNLREWMSYAESLIFCADGPFSAKSCDQTATSS
jgi:hypothetical protein